MVTTETQALESVSGLFSWSQNYDFPSPASLYLDLIGYSEDEYGARLCTDRQPSLGYLECGMLGDALTAYADHPGAVYTLVEQLLAAESEAA
jgi:hypothetical protein